MEITKELLQKYARLVVGTGAGVQPGQVVSILAAVDQHEFACMVMEECYKAGAKRVSIDWDCDEETRLTYAYTEEAVLSEVLPWQVSKLQQAADDLAVRIYIESSDPDALAGIDPQKLSNVMRARTKVTKPIRDKIDGKYQWCIVAIPSPVWAKKCFPDLSEEDAVAALWDAVLKTVRVDADSDPVQRWQAHTDLLTEKSAWLNEQAFTSLRYHSANGTDFSVELIPGAVWAGAKERNPVNDVWYVPNMPTEEIFNSPMAGKCEGTLVATKPLSWNGQLIENFSITFENGKAVSCKAEKGQETLEQMIAMDETSCMLGEVALVPKESPVNQCGFLFFNTLFDENACCHVALGCGFKEVLPGGNDMTVQEAQAKGINDSCIHVDFMIGSDDLSIDGIRPDGAAVPVFRNGTWA